MRVRTRTLVLEIGIERQQNLLNLPLVRWKQGFKLLRVQGPDRPSSLAARGLTVTKVQRSCW